MINRLIVGVFALLSGCVGGWQSSPPAKPVAFTIGQPYQVDGEWYYPRIFSSYDVTGLGVVSDRPANSYTTDNEIYSPNGLTAASPVLPLPSIVTITNLVNGRSVQVRVNDRGPDMAGRVIAVSPLVAKLLGFPAAGVVEVGVTLDNQASGAVQSSLGAGPQLKAAPVTGITSQSLAPPGSNQQNGAQQQLLQASPGEAQSQGPSLTGLVSMTTPSPGPLWVRVSGFGSVQGAARTMARLDGMSARIVPVSGGDRTLWAVETGPYMSVSAADQAMQRELALGIAGPEIVVR